MRSLFRLLILFSVVLTAYYLPKLVSLSYLFYLHIPILVPPIFAIVAGWYTWQKICTSEETFFSNVVLGALILGGTGYTLFLLGVMIKPVNSQGLLRVLYFSGPAGVIIGAILGLIVGKRKSNAWRLLLWSCAIVSATIIISSKIYYTFWHPTKYSSEKNNQTIQKNMNQNTKK